jgi:polar amino acid transport system substrate-binding protein
VIKRFTIILFVITTVLLLVGCSKKKSSGPAPLRVGMELQYPPFEMSDSVGNSIGVSVDMANKVGEFLGRPVEIRPIAWTGLIPSLKTGKIDLVISSMTATDKRRLSVDFSDPYIVNGLAILVGNESDISSFASIDSSARIAVKTGTIGDVFVKTNLSSNRVYQFETVNAAVMEVAQGRADLFIYDPLTLYNNAQKHSTTTKVILDFIPGTSNFSAVAVKKGNAALLNSVNLAIKEMQKSGFFDTLGEKYLSDIKQMYESKGLPFYFDIN